MTEDAFIACALAAYLLVALVTFGHGWNEASAYCDQHPPDGDEAVCGTVGGLVSAGAWPLYWSVQAWHQ